MVQEYHPKYSQTGLSEMYGTLFGRHVDFIGDARKVDAALDLVFETLTQREWRVLDLHLGLRSGEGKGLQEIAADFYENWSPLEEKARKYEIAYDGKFYVIKKGKELPPEPGKRAITYSRARRLYKTGMSKMRRPPLMQILGEVLENQ